MEPRVDGETNVDKSGDSGHVRVAEENQPTNHLEILASDHHKVVNPTSGHTSAAQDDDVAKTEENTSEPEASGSTPPNGDKTEQSSDVSESTSDKQTTPITSETDDRKFQGMYFYRDRPIFGLDIGYESVKVMQIKREHGSMDVTGYGVMQFDPKIIKEGVITDPETLSKLLKSLLEKNVMGIIDAKRVVMAIPAARTFIRSVTLPVDALEDLSNAVRLEIERYTPMPLKEMYMDFSVINKTAKDVRLLVAAVPVKIANSYLAVAYNLGLDVIALEPTLVAVGRLFANVDRANEPTLLVDCGAVSTDVIVYDKAVVTASTVPSGGETLNTWISENMHVSREESHFLKSRFGIGTDHKQREIMTVVKPQLDQIVLEMRRVMRYYEEQFNNKKISQIVVTGGGSNLLGLSDYLTEALKVSTRSFIPWEELHFKEIEKPSGSDRSMYVTAGGLALLTPQEIFA